jgi:cytosine/adenosine deaminase-related metal-dependent hydrolase
MPRRLGVDGKALDEDDDALPELRLAHLLHAGTGFKAAVSRKQMLQIAFANGRSSVTDVDDGGTIATGVPADILLLDWAASNDDRLRNELKLWGARRRRDGMPRQTRAEPSRPDGRGNSSSADGTALARASFPATAVSGSSAFSELDAIGQHPRKRDQLA